MYVVGGGGVGEFGECTRYHPKHSSNSFGLIIVFTKVKVIMPAKVSGLQTGASAFLSKVMDSRGGLNVEGAYPSLFKLALCFPNHSLNVDS